MQRSENGLALVETLTPAGAEISQVTDRAAADAVLRGPVRVLVDRDDRIIGLTPDVPADGVTQRPSAGGLVAANFGGPAGGSISGQLPGVRGAGHFPAAPDLLVITVDGRKAKIDEVTRFLGGHGPAGGFLVWHGSDPVPRSLAQAAHDLGLHTLEPGPSRFPEPVVVDRTGHHLVSPTGWLMEDPAGNRTADHRAALSGDDLARMVESRAPEGGIAELDPAASGVGWLAHVNPWSREGGEFLTNCILAAIGTDMALQEHGTLAFQVSPSPPMGLADLVRYANDPAREAVGSAQPFEFRSVTVGDIRNALVSADVWDRGFVFVPGAPGHVFNAVRLEQGPAFLDGQLGKVIDPPDETRVLFLPVTEGLVVDGPVVTELPDQIVGAARSELRPSGSAQPQRSQLPTPGEVGAVDDGRVANVETSVDAGTTRVALGNLHLVLDQRPSWVESWEHIDEGLALRQAARAFGEEFAARLAGQLSGTTVDPNDVTAFLHIESVSVVRGYASLAFLQEAAAAAGSLGRLPVQSVAPLSAVLDELDPQPSELDTAALTGDDRYTARGARAFLRANDHLFREQLAREIGGFLDRTIAAGDISLAPPVPAVPRSNESFPPGTPASIELQLLKPDAKSDLGAALVQDASVRAALTDQHGPRSSSAVAMHERARTPDGRQAIEERNEAEREISRRRDAKTAPRARGPQPGASTRLPNGVRAIVPADEDNPLLQEALDHAGRLAVHPDTVTVAGLVVRDGERIHIADGMGVLYPAGLVGPRLVDITAPDAAVGRTLVLNLYGDRSDAESFALRTARIIDQNALLGRPVPNGLVLGIVDQESGQTEWRASIPRGGGLLPPSDLGAAISTVRAQAPAAVNLAEEMRDRIRGYTRNPELSNAQVLASAQAQVEDLPSYSERAGQGVETFEETEIRVPVRPGAKAFEQADWARRWLNPFAIREAVSRGQGLNTISVRIGPGLQAYAHRIAATDHGPETYATTVGHVERYAGANYRVWVNRHQPVAGQSGPVTMTVVPLPVFQDWALLDTLPVDVLERLIIEPGRVRRGRLEVGGESLTVQEYVARLPSMKDKPIVVLAHRRESPDELRFVEELSRHACVIQAVKPDVGDYQVFLNGQLRAVVNVGAGGLEAAFSLWTTRTDAHGEYTAEVTSLDTAMELLRNNKLGKPSAEGVLVIRRRMALAVPAGGEVISGWLKIRPSTMTSIRKFLRLGHRRYSPGPLSELLAQYPSGLIPLSPEQPSAGENILVQVPARYATRIESEGKSWPVMDLSALIEADARIGDDGRIIVPTPASARLGVEVVQDLLSTLQDAGSERPEELVGRMFRTLTGAGASIGGAAVSTWAEDLGAGFRAGTALDLEKLGAGSVTPIRTDQAGLVLAVGSERLDEPLLLTPDGEIIENSEHILSAGIQLLLNGEGLLAQVDLSVPRHVIVDLRGLPGAPEANPPAPLFTQVAERIAASGQTVPDDLDDRLSSRVSNSVARRLSMRAVEPKVLDSLIEDATRDPAAAGDEGAFRRELLSGVTEFVRNIAPQISAAQIETLVNAELAESPPELAGSWISEGMIRGIGMRVVTGHSSAHPTHGGRDVSRRRSRVPRTAAPTISETTEERLAAPLGGDTPSGPIVSFHTDTPDGQRIDVVVVDQAAAGPREVEQALSELANALEAAPGPSTLGPRGFLVLDRVGGEHDQIYRTMARDYGLRLVLPQPAGGGETVATRLGATRLAARAGWAVENERGDRRLLPAGGESTTLDRMHFAVLYESGTLPANVVLAPLDAPTSSGPVDAGYRRVSASPRAASRGEGDPIVGSERRTASRSDGRPHRGAEGRSPAPTAEGNTRSLNSTQDAKRNRRRGILVENPGSAGGNRSRVGDRANAEQDASAGQVAVPDSVRSMSRLFEGVSRGASRDPFPTRLAARRFPTGLRSMPSADADTVRTADWVGERLENPTMAGVHSPRDWAAFRGLIDRAGEDGMVMTLPEAGQDVVVYVKTGGEIWRVRSGPDGVSTERWTEPPALPVGVEAPPRRALGFNKCGDFLL
ncbi:hypothetical protein ACFQZ8_02720 [Micromonospora azadirachtae]|uniref:Uncharacterized protein n=1 Tax=Micromonospora azadirachtae TaxID=1970735 RepID=A0ABW2ZW16_9ACTN